MQKEAEKEEKIRENLAGVGPEGTDEYIGKKEKEKNPQIIEASLRKIQEEQEEVERSIQNTLKKVAKKFASVGVDILACTALDIDGADLRKEVEFLRNCHTLKESNERALLRLRTNRLSEEFMARQNRISQLVEKITEWTEKIQKNIEEVEASIVERATLSEVYTGAYIVDRYKEFLKETEPVEYILENACNIAEAHSELFTQKERTDFALSESFIKITSHEERALVHLLSVFRD